MTETIRRTPRRLIAAFVLTVALLSGLAAGCSDEGGMYQGGNDSAPSWR